MYILSIQNIVYIILSTIYYYTFVLNSLAAEELRLREEELRLREKTISVSSGVALDNFLFIPSHVCFNTFKS